MSDDWDDPDAPASEGEMAASQRLRDALEGGADEAGADDAIALALALKAAWQPGALSEDESLAAIDAVPTEEELRFAGTLREALETGAAADDGASFALSLRAAYAPGELDDVAHGEILAAALGSREHDAFVAALKAAYDPKPIGIAEHKAMVEAALAKMPARRRSNVVRVMFGAAATGLALAAAIFLVLTPAPIHGGEKSLARARTTQPLFDEPFKTGETSARIDRIASARAGDYRDNQFTKWGVR